MWKKLYLLQYNDSVFLHVECFASYVVKLFTYIG